jgi:hypothetical protein
MYERLFGRGVCWERCLLNETEGFWYSLGDTSGGGQILHSIRSCCAAWWVEFPQDCCIGRGTSEHGRAVLMRFDLWVMALRIPCKVLQVRASTVMGKLITGMMSELCRYSSSLSYNHNEKVNLSPCRLQKHIEMWRYSSTNFNLDTKWSQEESWQFSQNKRLWGTEGHYGCFLRRDFAFEFAGSQPKFQQFLIL